MTAQKNGMHYFNFRTGMTLNSGLVAILFAISLGVEDIFLPGYDCSLENGGTGTGNITD
jgi:hypothetical protein